MAREWDVPKRDLLDIERTAQAERVAAADDLAQAASRVLDWIDSGCDPSAISISELRRTLDTYNGPETVESLSNGTVRVEYGHLVPAWTPEDILRNEG